MKERPNQQELVEKNILKGKEIGTRFFFISWTDPDDIRKPGRESGLFKAGGIDPPEFFFLFPFFFLFVVGLVDLDPKIAPALQLHAEELKRAKLESALAHKIETRPSATQLVNNNILHGKWPEKKQE